MTSPVPATATSASRHPVARSTARPKPPVPIGLTITLAAVPNKDFRPGSHEATVEVAAHIVEVGNIAEAVKTFGAFLVEYDLGGGNVPSIAGVIRRAGVPIARVGFGGRLWAVDASGRETGQELVGEVAP